MTKKSEEDVLLEEWDEAAKPSNVPNFSVSELAEILGVQPESPGMYNSMQLINACMKAQTLPSVRKLDRSERIRVLRSSFALIDLLMPRGFPRG